MWSLFLLLSLMAMGCEVYSKDKLINSFRSVDRFTPGVHLLQIKNCSGVSGPLYIRGGGSSDTAVARGVFNGPEFVFLDKIFARTMPTTILDLGGNAGMTGTLFARRYPNATVVAVEAEINNFHILSLNAALAGFTPIFGAIHGDVDPPQFLSLRSASQSWGFGVKENDDNDSSVPLVPVYTVPKLLAKLGWARIDLLKIDVECAEYKLMLHDPAWLDLVTCISIELHGRIDCQLPRRGPNALRVLLGGRFQSVGRYGELGVYCQPLFDFPGKQENKKKSKPEANGMGNSAANVSPSQALSTPTAITSIVATAPSLNHKTWEIVPIITFLVGLLLGLASTACCASASSITAKKPRMQST